MDSRLFMTVFATVFLAELGDKTQLATMLYSARSPGARWVVFAAASAGLVLASGIGVLAGDLVSRTMDPRTLTRIAGALFVVVGVWTIAQA